ncbi:hypothetical protein MKS88_000785 [Plasmodium brasilianum]|uniref:Uncharacterized protein n=2 Tax=Plasmodium (Plasmodium) TaxID=418103 RepID=A0A1D3PB73_PLAMA|nr:Plasmodium exported protein, unknown function [Plasmodium malariae]KAI4841017.1 hypothetical protein MKS88_000785 [Plasmodium brasilianum]SCN12465.1 Plasmodium exported protein, unknown function [Plasmodium malariae]
MEGKIKTNLYVKICSFILLIWICNFYNDESMYNNSLYERHNIGGKLYTRTYRLLTLHKREHGSNKVGLKEKISLNKAYEKNKQYNGCSIINAKGYNNSRKSKPSVNHEGYTYNKKKLLDKIYYINKVRNSMNLDTKYLRMTTYNNYKFFYALPLLLLLAGILIFVLEKYLDVTFLYEALSIAGQWNISMLSIILVSVFTLIVLPTFIYIFKNLVKDNKSIYLKSKLYNTKYPYFTNLDY